MLTEVGCRLSPTLRTINQSPFVSCTATARRLPGAVSLHHLHDEVPGA
jgi:hypothetical protein